MYLLLFQRRLSVCGRCQSPPEEDYLYRPAQCLSQLLLLLTDDYIGNLKAARETMPGKNNRNMFGGGVCFLSGAKRLDMSNILAASSLYRLRLVHTQEPLQVALMAVLHFI